MSRDSKKIGGRGWVRRSAGRVAARICRWSLHFTCRSRALVYVEAMK